jgi:hypothetical protein
MDHTITAITNNRGDNVIYLKTDTLLDYLNKEKVFEAMGRKFNRTAFRTWCYKNSLTRIYKGAIKDNKGNVLPLKYFDQHLFDPKVCRLHITDGDWNLDQLINKFFYNNWRTIETELKTRANNRRNNMEGEYYTPHGRGFLDNKVPMTPACHLHVEEMKPTLFLPNELTYNDALRLQNEINKVLANFKPSQVRQTKRFRSNYWANVAKRVIEKWTNWQLPVDEKGSIYNQKWQPKHKDEEE